MCVSVCVCLSHLGYLEWEVVSPRCLHCFEELRLASCSNCFLNLHDVLFKRKSLKFFHQLCTDSCAHTVSLPVTLCQMNLTHYRKAVGTFPKGMCWKTRGPHHRYHSCYCFLCEWAIDTPCEQVTDILSSMNKNTSPFVNGLQLVLYNNTRILCVCVCVSVSVCLCLCVCVSVWPDISGTGGRIATLFTPSWRALPGELHKLLFGPRQHTVWEKKPLEAFCQLRAQSCACTVTLAVTLGNKNLAHY